MTSGLSIIDFDRIAQYNINSDFDSLNQSDSTSNFSVRINIDWIYEYERISIGQVSIPKSFYLINSKNNTFILFNALAGTSSTITIPVGQYNAGSLAVELQRLLRLPINQGGGGVNLAVVGFSDLYGKFSFSTTDPNIFANTYEILFTNSLYEVLGGYSPKEEGQAFQFPGIGPSASRLVYMPYKYNLNAYSNLYLLCDMVASNNSQNNSNILCALYTMSAATDTYAVQSFDILQNSKAISKRSNVLNFRIINQYGEEMDFNGIGCTFSLYFFKLKK